MNQQLALLKFMGIRFYISYTLYELKFYILRNILCRFGWHKTYPSGEKYHMNSRGVYLHTYYIKCLYCGIIYFPTKCQKEMYNRIQESKKQMFRNQLIKVK